MVKNKFFFVGILCLLATVSNAQVAKYLVLFKDKNSSPFSTNEPRKYLSERAIARRAKQGIVITERDLPPNPAYVSGVAGTGARVWYRTRWANGVLVEATATQLAAMLALPFVKGYDSNLPLSFVPQNTTIGEGGKFAPETPLAVVATQPKDFLDYGPSQTQIGQMRVDSLHARGFRGEGLWIAVLDNGFAGVSTHAPFKHIYNENRLLGTYDFVARNANVYDQGTHGSHVLSTMAAYQPGGLIGTAYKASYLLLHTEDNSGERLQEEAFWLIGAEYADSTGVDVINSSLGYTTFDNPATNHVYADMNGDKTIATRAADWAAQAGILVVIAAGNEGNGAWRYVSSPADADSIIAVGAVTASMAKASFSSFGPSIDGRIKPDLSAMGSGVVIINAANGALATGGGTSFASPLLAGMAASFWGEFPSLTNMEVIALLKQAGHLAENPNNELGFGVPNYLKTRELAENYQQGTVRLRPNPTGDGQRLVAEMPFNVDNLPVEIRLLDTRGAVIWESRVSGRMTEIPVDTLTLAPGMYFLNFKTEKASHTARWVKR